MYFDIKNKFDGKPYRTLSLVGFGKFCAPIFESILRIAFVNFDQ